MAALDWVVRVVRGLFSGRRRDRARMRRLIEEGDIDELVRVYHRCGRSDAHRERRMAALAELAKADPARAEPLLRDVIEGPDDPWMVMAALDTAAREGLVGLQDVIATAKDDPRPVVAATADVAARKLARTTA